MCSMCFVSVSNLNRIIFLCPIFCGILGYVSLVAAYEHNSPIFFSSLGGFSKNGFVAGLYIYILGILGILMILLGFRDVGGRMRKK